MAAGYPHASPVSAAGQVTPSKVSPPAGSADRARAAHALGPVAPERAVSGRRITYTAVCACGTWSTRAHTSELVYARHARHVDAAVERVPVDRTNPRWRRMRAACCPFAGDLPAGMTIDEHVDAVFSLLPTER